MDIYVAENPPIYQVHTDHLDTPKALTDETRQIVWRADYNPFGMANITTGQVTNNVRFPGQYFDAETGLHYNWHRYYDSATGRYITADPIGILNRYSDPAIQMMFGESIKGIENFVAPGSLNHLYGYVDQNPVNKVDPTGLSAKVIISTGIAAILACKKIKSCRDRVEKLLEEAKEACKKVECQFKRAPANHKFPGLGFCQHYEFTCWIEGKKGSQFHLQLPLPGTCRKNPNNQF